MSTTIGRRRVGATISSLIVAVLAAAPAARAVIVATNPPGDPPPAATALQPTGIGGWFNLGRMSIGGGVYLGNGWFLTAQHLDPATNNTIFLSKPADPSQVVAVGLDAGSTTRLVNGVGYSDMALIHVAAGSQTTLDGLGLRQLNISTTTPDIDTPITLAGVGSVRGSFARYDATYDPLTGKYTWTTNPNGQFAGYQFDPGDNAVVEKRWGTNVTTAVNAGQATEVVANPINGSRTVVFGADFTDPAGVIGATTYEAIGVNHDSGGVVFGQDGTLLGILLYEATFQDQPAGTALFGNFTYASDLSQYYAQISTVTGVPEPTATLAATAMVALLLRRRSLRDLTSIRGRS